VKVIIVVFTAMKK